MTRRSLPTCYAFDMKRKRRIDQSVVSIERHKKRYLAALAKGRAPTVAARIAGLHARRFTMVRRTC